MSHKVIETVLGSALTASGTLTLSYPTGTNPGTFANGKRHKVVTGNGDKFPMPKYATVSFGATTITLTWGSSSPTLPVGTKLYVQLDAAGKSPQSTAEARDPALGNTAAVALKIVDWGAPLTADSDGVSASQSVSAGASFALDGALLSTIVSGRMIFDVPRNVVAAWTTTSILTITGKDEYGNTMVEKSASGTSHTGKKAFKEITSVSSSASITSATVGTGNILGLPVFLTGPANIVAEFENGINIKPAAKVFLPWEIEATELSAGTAEQLVCPVDGYIDQARGIVQEAIVTGGDITFKVGTTDVTGLTLTVANSDAAGTRYSDRPTTPRDSSTVVAKGDRLQVVPAAAFNGGGAVNGVLEIEAHGVQGTLVVGLTTASAATSNDVRGTYAPRTAPDGATRYALLLQLADPDFQGQDQYAG